MQGSSASTMIAVTPVGAYSGTVTLACGGLPANSACIFSPALVTYSGSDTEVAQSVTLTIATNVSGQAMLRELNRGWGGGTGEVLTCVSLLLLPVAGLSGMRHKGAWLQGLALIFLVGVFVSIAACGSSSSSQMTGLQTPLGTSTVVISSPGSSQSLSLMVTVAK